MKHFYLLSVLFLCLSVVTCPGQETELQNSAESIGPENGYLIIAGGGHLDSTIVGRFLDLAGGKDSPVVIIPTAGEKDTIDKALTVRFLQNLGATNVEVLHTRDPREADTESFVQPLLHARGVWFGGGRQWRLVDAYAGTRTEKEIKALLERGGVVGGSSAGASIQGTFLVRGDTRTNTIMMGDHREGFNYLKNSAIDQHLLVRNRQFDLIEVLEAHPRLLGIGLDEGTAILVHQNTFEVLGSSFVAVYDTGLWDSVNRDDSRPALPNGGKFFLLRKGDRYDLMERKVVHWSGFNRGISSNPDIR